MWQALRLPRAEQPKTLDQLKEPTLQFDDLTPSDFQAIRDNAGAFSTEQLQRLNLSAKALEDRLREEGVRCDTNNIWTWRRSIVAGCEVGIPTILAGAGLVAGSFLGWAVTPVMFIGLGAAGCTAAIGNYLRHNSNFQEEKKEELVELLGKVSSGKSILDREIQKRDKVRLLQSRWRLGAMSSLKQRREQALMQQIRANQLSRLDHEKTLRHERGESERLVAQLQQMGGYKGRYEDASRALKKVESRSSKYDEMTIRLSELESHLRALAMQRHEVSVAKDALIGELQLKLKELEAARQSIEIGAVKADEMSQKVATLEREVALTKGELDQARLEMVSLQSDLDMALRQAEEAKGLLESGLKEHKARESLLEVQEVELKEQLNEVSESSARAEAEKRSLQGELEKLQVEQVSLSEMLKSERRNRDQQQRQLEANEAKQLEVKKQLEMALTTIRELKKDFDDLRLNATEIGEWKTKIAVDGERLKALQEKVAELRESKVLAQVSVQSLQGRVEEAETERDRQLEAVKELQEKFADQVKTLKATISSGEQGALQAAQDLKTTKHSLNTLQQELERIKEEKNELARINEELLEKQSTLVAAQVAAEQAGSRAAKAEERNKELEGGVKALESLSRQREERIEQLSGELQEKSGIFEKLSAEHARLKKQMEVDARAATTTVERLHGEHREKLASLEARLAEHEETVRQKEQLLSDIAAVQEQLEKASEEEVSHQAIVSRLNNTVSLLKKQVSSAEGVSENLEDEITGFKEQLEERQEYLVNLSEELESAQQEVGDTENKLAESNGQNKQLNQDLQEARSTVEALEKELEAVQADFQQLVNELIPGLQRHSELLAMSVSKTGNDMQLLQEELERERQLGEELKIKLAKREASELLAISQMEQVSRELKQATGELRVESQEHQAVKIKLKEAQTAVQEHESVMLELQSLREKHENLVQEAVQLRTGIESVRRESGERAGKLEEELKISRHQRDKDLANYGARNATLEAQLVVMRGEVQQSSVTVSQMERENQELMRNIELLRQKIEEIDYMEPEPGTHRARVDQKRKKQLEENTLELAELHHQLDQKDSAIQEGVNELAGMKAAFDNAKRIAVNRSRELDQLKTEMEVLKKELQTKSDDVTTMDDTVGELESRIREQSGLIGQKDNQLISVEQDRDAVNNKLKAMEEANQSLDERLHKIEEKALGQYSELRRKEAELQKQGLLVEELQEQLTYQQDEIQKKTERLRNWEKELRQKEEELHLYEEKVEHIESLEERGQERSLVLRDVQQTLRAREKALADTTSQLDFVKAQLPLVAKRVEDQELTIERLEGQLAWVNTLTEKDRETRFDSIVIALEKKKVELGDSHPGFQRVVAGLAGLCQLACAMQEDNQHDVLVQQLKKKTGGQQKLGQTELLEMLKQRMSVHMGDSYQICLEAIRGYMETIQEGDREDMVKAASFCTDVLMDKRLSKLVQTNWKDRYDETEIQYFLMAFLSEDFSDVQAITGSQQTNCQKAAQKLLDDVERFSTKDYEAPSIEDDWQRAVERFENSIKEVLPDQLYEEASQQFSAMLATVSACQSKCSRDLSDLKFKLRMLTNRPASQHPAHKLGASRPDVDTSKVEREIQLNEQYVQRLNVLMKRVKDLRGVYLYGPDSGRQKAQEAISELQSKVYTAVKPPFNEAQLKSLVKSDLPRFESLADSLAPECLLEGEEEFFLTLERVGVQKKVVRMQLDRLKDDDPQKPELEESIRYYSELESLLTKLKQRYFNRSMLVSFSSLSSDQSLGSL